MHLSKLASLTLLMATLGTACAEEAEDPPARTTTNSCVTAGAAYKFSYDETSGSCGALSEETLVTSTDGTIEASSGCELGPGARNDGCAVFIDSRCKGTLDDGTAYTSNSQGKVDWADDGAGATGTVTLTIVVEGDSCRSTYTVTATKL